MKWTFGLGVAAVVLAAAGCEYFNRGPSGPVGGTAPPTSSGEEPSVEGFAIQLSTIPFTGPNHVREAAESKRKTEAATGWKGLYVVHEDQRSCVYLGRYATEKEAGADVGKVRAWKTPSGLAPFPAAIVVKRSGARVGPPEWDLAYVNDPNWPCTVVIAKFHNLPEENFLTRKETAVENCRDLRSRGEEAFYFHGPEQSLVTVGLFGPTPFRIEETPEGARRPVLQDEGIGKVMMKHPKLAINGYEAFRDALDPQTGRSQRVYTATYVTSLSEIRRGSSVPPAGGAGQPQPR